MEDILASIKRIIADDSQAVEEDAPPMEQTANKREMSRFGGEPLQLVEEMKTEQPAVLDEILELTQTFEPAESVEPKAAEKPAEPAQIEVARPVEAFVSRNVTSPMPTPVSSIVSDDTTSASRQSLAAPGVVLAIALVAPGRLTTGVAGALLGGAALLGRRHARSDRALRPRTRSAAGPSRQPDDPAA